MFIITKFLIGSDIIIYLLSLAYGPHHKEQKITSISPDGTIRQIESETSDSYQGMYNQSFPERCWSPDGKMIYFTTPCKSSVQSYALSLGTLINFSFVFKPVSVNLLFL